MKGWVKTKQELVVGKGSIKKGSLGQEDNRRRGPKKEDTVGRSPDDLFSQDWVRGRLHLSFGSLLALTTSSRVPWGLL